MFKNLRNNWLIVKLGLFSGLLIVIGRTRHYKATGVWPDAVLKINDTPVMHWKQGALNKDFERLD